ncbi:hypothetical protein GCM10010211_83360 [Streptomyces albospinus]|uniref:Uncharacterized protein n=1 Tax=Streptomyces albospinus TaxID=285515 RepID=A0ABQ2VNU6_9ACTN|nr:hypothetical protein GCM10010211_83360 [Streptomyces albospinus]
MLPPAQLLGIADARLKDGLVPLLPRVIEAGQVAGADAAAYRAGGLPDAGDYCGELLARLRDALTGQPLVDRGG